MIVRTGIFAMVASLLLLAAACSSGGDSGGGSGTYSTWIDVNRNSVYDPYEDPVQWDMMMAATGGMQTAAQAEQIQEQHQIRHQWRDSNGDGICDYAQDRDRWRQVTQAQWIDQNNDGICDNYPGRTPDGNGPGWQGGWR